MIIMILTDKQILERLKLPDNLSIDPLPKHQQIQPASIDLRLSDEFLLPHIDSPVDIKNGSPHYENVKCNVLQLPPRSFVLGTTIEKVHIPSDLIGRVEGRSSIGRLGVTIHVTAGFIDPNFTGQITLEIANLSNTTIFLYENMRICQMVLEELKTVPNRLYGEAGNKYQGQEGVTGSMIYYDDDTNIFGGKTQ